MRFRWFAVILCLKPLWSLDPATWLSQYKKDTWQIESGLPQNFVNAIVQRPDRYLLVGTEEGLAAFDGMRFTPFTVGGQRPFAQEWVTELLYTRDGDLWVGTYRQGLFRVHHDRIQHFTIDDGLADLGVRELHQDSAGDVWILTLSGVHRYRNGKLQRVRDMRGVGGYRWCTMAEQSDGSLFIITADGLLQYTEQHWNHVLPESSQFGEPLSVYADRQNRLWLGSSKGLYFRAPGMPWRHVPGIRGRVSAILQDSQGVLWVGTWGDGLYRWKNGSVDHWRMADGLSDNFVRTLYEDSENNLWIGSRSGGLTRWADVIALSFGVAEGLDGPFASAVAAGRDGTVWLGTWRSGFYRWQSGRLSPITPPQPTRQFIVRALATDATDTVWVGTWEQLYSYRNGRWQSYQASPGSPSAIVVSRSGALWVGRDNHGLHRYRRTPSGLADEAEYLPQHSVTALMEASDGSLFAATTSGLYRFYHGTGAAERVLAGDITALMEDTRDRVWAALRGGRVMVWSKNGSVAFSSANGFPESRIMSFVQDLAGNLWCSSARGIYRYSARDIDRLLTGEVKRIGYTAIGRSDGMPSIECHGWSQPASLRARDGRLWFPTVAGFVQIRPERLGSQNISPVYLERLTLAGKMVDPADGVRLPPRARDLVVHLNAIHLAAPGKIEFRYRMAGFDPEWQTTRNRSIPYSSLPAGRFDFEVMARVAGGDWSLPKVLVSVEQLPVFWETIWFYLLLLATGCGLAWMVHFFRARQSRSRLAAVQAERGRIAREWHDTLLADFAAISWQLDATSTALSSEPARAGTALELARAMVRYSQTEARRVIWDLRDSQDDDGALVTSIQRTLETITAGSGIQVSMLHEGEGRERALSLAARRHLLRICQEAISNSVRHAHPAHIEVSAVFTTAAAEITITDDGCGFDSRNGHDRPGHFGIAGMKDRANLLGGTLEIRSSLGAGTRVDVVVPLPDGRVQDQS
jgi:ligand-binding sensor domain-containing protein/two-component sensor histidine kinase